MTSEVPGTSGRRYKNDSAKVVPIDEYYADKGVLNVSIQTGEEFSPEFLRDRVSPRRAPVVTDTDQHQPKRVGFNQLVYEDLTGLLGIRRRDSESGTDVSAEVEQNDYSDVVSRYHRNYRAGDQHSDTISNEINSDQVGLGLAVTPVYASDSPLSYQPYGSRVSDGSLSGKMKFLCSFGGRILPRPSDGKLRYVGGETRIISIRKNSAYSELVKKTSAICIQSHTIKYQLPGEDLDALISVSSDEDLHHMIEEYHDLERSSQRLRIFLLSLGEADSPCSFESRNAQQNDSDYQYVVAVNGMMDPSPRRSSSGQSLSSQTSHWGSTVDYSPTFQRDSPNSVQPLETRDGSNSPNLALTLSNPTTHFSNRNKSFNQSPPLSPLPVQLIDPKNTRKQLYEDCAFLGSRERNVPYGDAYRVDEPIHYYNQPHGPLQVMNHRIHHNKHLIGPKKIGEVHFHNRSPSKDFVSSRLYVENDTDFGRPILNIDMGLQSEKFISSRDETMHLFPGPDVPIGSHNRMSHAVSDSQLQREGKSNYDLEDGKIPWYRMNFKMEKSPSLAMSSSSQELQQQEVTAEQYRSAKNENLLTFKSLDKEYMEWRLDMYNKGDFLGWEEKHCDEKGNPRWHSNSMENNLFYNYANSVPAKELQVTEGTSSASAAIALEDFANTVRDLTSDYQLYPDEAVFFVKSQKATVDQQNDVTETISSGTDAGLVRDISVLKVGSGGYSFVESKFRDGIFVRSEFSNNGLENGVLESVVIVEDVTDSLPPEVPSSSTIVRHVQDDPSAEVSSSGETESKSSAPESDSEDVKHDGNDKDESISVAAIAEMEAGIYGLQIIKNDDLEDLQELGSGTFGTVYHGKWRGTNVAIKRIKKSCFAGRSSEQERLTKDFWREAQILSKLHHPNVVAFYGVVPDGPGRTLATVTEFMADGSLRHVLLKKDRKALDWRKKLIIAMDAAFGMEYLHLKNIVHFDLKCDNLLVNLGDPQQPVCKVGDFGLSRIKRNTLVSGGVRGTLPWMAPELLNGSSSRVSEKVDVFSFGITMWEILTGEEPYANMHCGGIIGGIVSNTLRPPVPDCCSPEWKKLMEECWSPDPTARPSFTEITNRLRVMSMAVQPKRHNRVRI
ncbi:uncharacterized protein LOC130755628 isoform X1 [Actinidia eriantha]|uniref:uncharacterized protein LOC130755628 isoform X1 n=1 Tax=Actinidia eriantha TaxID=165200 RepID=UPI00258F6C6B|nr:uncharacterized protein LOC130755628 isoform X1 [Actinidia eriantha]